MQHASKAAAASANRHRPLLSLSLTQCTLLPASQLSHTQAELLRPPPPSRCAVVNSSPAAHLQACLLAANSR